MDRADQTVLRRVLEAAGLSVVSFVVFIILAKFLAPNPGEDKMNFKLLKSHKPPRFNLSDHWAGALPEAAQEVLDIFNYPEVYAHFGSQLPKGYFLTFVYSDKEEFCCMDNLELEKHILLE